MRPGQLPPLALRLFLPAFELGLAGGLRLVLDCESGTERFQVDGAFLQRPLMDAQLTFPLLDSREQRVEPALGIGYSGFGIGQNAVGHPESPGRWRAHTTAPALP